MKFTPSPCKDCKNREIGCHSTCEKYIKYSKLNAKDYEERRREQDYKSFVYDSIERRRKYKHPID